MSIRPVNLDEFPETSFEDMESTFGKINTNQDQEPAPVSPLGRNHGVLPTPSSASSNGTTFSISKGKRLSVGSSSRTDEEGEEDEDDFLNDFQEFQGKKDDIDDAFKTYFNLNDNDNNTNNNNNDNNNKDNSGPRKRKSIDFIKDFDEKLNLRSSRGSSRLRQRQSMMELKPHLKPSSSFSRIPNSLSAGDLRIRPNASVRFKKSMPALSNFNGMIREEDELEDDLPTLKRPQRFLDNFEEAREEEEQDDKDFVFDESLIQPQFLNRAPESPLRLSPSQYDIIRDDTLLTPRLHRRHRDWNSKDQLDSFKERRKSEQQQQHQQKQRRKGYHHHNRPQTASRIQIIKQEIDQNTPIKNGSMYYNPKTMKWEGNEHILDKFNKLESQDEKPLLIRARTSAQEPLNSATDGSHIEKISKRNSNRGKSKQSHQRIVGKMMFDEENLKWVNIDEDEEDADPFANVEDIAPLPTAPGFDGAHDENTLKAPSSGANNNGNKHISPFLRSHSQILPSGANSLDRLNSSATTRYHSVGFTRSDNTNPQFQLNSRQLEKFWHEENKWNRKVGAWFIMGDSSDAQPGDLTDFNEVKNPRSFMYEIRNMVLNSTR
ncbi:hypothetical protein ZYGR_0Z01950 [Zygosaccharomyces rouxii]|uniref:Uncharacterized protein n=1 Tax=Zygosaccharomyces rouxii TaxID=4956 RepID=A0A1Q3A4Y6_ZYGRO|nr:hypothetical protein ZYGR_0Z01950 [Zygosaccharomyces rouxii]